MKNNNIFIMDAVKITMVIVIFVQYNCKINMFSMALLQYKTLIRYTGCDELYFNSHHIVDILNVANAKRCASFCGQHDECKSFFFNVATETCRLHDAEYFDIDSGISELNWKFYVIENKECPAYLGFIHDEAGGMCVHVAKNRQRFADGQQYCSLLDARVISLETTKKRIAFTNFVQRADVAPLLPSSNIMFGLHKTNGVWRWESGAALSDSNWGTGQPFCPTTLVCECASVLLDWAGHTWNDDVCAGRGTIICEYDGK